MPEEYVIPLSIDVAGIIQKSSSVKTSLTEVGEAAKKAGNEAKTGFDNASKGSQDLSTKLVDNSVKYNLLTKNVEQLQIQMQSYERIAKTSLDTKIITEYNGKVEALKTQINQLLNAGKKGFDDLGNAVKGSGNFLSQAFSKVRELAYILPGVGIAGIIAFATGPIIEYISKLDLFKAKITEDKALTEAFGSTDYSKAIEAVTELGVNVKLAKEGFIDKDHVIDQYNESIGKVTGNVDSLDAAEQGLVKHAADFIRITLLKAAATVILNDAAKDAADVAEKNQKLQEKINDLNQVKKTVAANTDPAAFGGDARGVINSANSQIVSLNKDIVKNNADLKVNTDKRIEILTNFNEQQAALLKKNGQTPIVGQGDKSGVAAIAKLRNDNANLDLQIQKQQDQLIIDDQTKSFKTRLDAITDFYNKSLQITKNNSDLERSVKGLSATQIANIDKKQQLDDFNSQVDFQKKKDALQKQEDQKNNDLINLKKSLNDKLISLQNEYNSAQINALDEAQTKEIAKNDVDFQNRVKTLQQQQKDLIDQKKQYDKKVKEGLADPGADQLFLDNIRQISLNIQKVTEEGQAADLTIIAKYAALKLKAQQDSLRAIGVLLKDETDARIEAIRANYAKVTAEAKKNGVLTDDLQKKLIKQQEADISDVQSKAIDKRLVEVQELEEAGINASSKKKGQTQKDFEEQLQRELLAIDIKGTQQRIGALAAVLATQGGLTPDQTKLLGQLTKKLTKDLGTDEANKEDDKLNIFRKLGIDQDTQTKIQQYAAAASQVGKITADLFGGLADAANAQVDAIQKQIDALSALLQADQDAVDKQQALSDKGRANSLDAAKKKLADDQKLKEGLQKQEEAAAKKRDQLQKAQIIADGIAQVSNLITAATEIYKSVSVIPVIGPALAFAAVAAMFAGFAVAKVTAFNSVNSQTAEEGGVAGGDRHSNGGNKYVSMDGKDTKILEIEKGERIFSRKNSEKHKRLFEAIQSNDYSKLDINDVSISDLLRGTGVMSQLDVARNTGNSNITLQDRANNVVIVANNSDKYLSSIDKKMDNLHRKEPIVIDFGDYIWIDYGNGHTERKFK